MRAIACAAPLEVESVAPAAFPLSSDKASAAVRSSVVPAVAVPAEICAASTEIAVPALAVSIAARWPTVAVMVPLDAVSRAPRPATRSPLVASPVTDPPAITSTLPPLFAIDPIRASPVTALTVEVPRSVSVPTRNPVAIAPGPGGSSPVRLPVVVAVRSRPAAADAIRASVEDSIATSRPACSAVVTRTSSFAVPGVPPRLINVASIAEAPSSMYSPPARASTESEPVTESASSIEAAAASTIMLPFAETMPNCAARPASIDTERPAPLAAILAAPKALSNGAVGDVSAIATGVPPAADKLAPLALPLSIESASPAARVSVIPAIALWTEICGAVTEIEVAASRVPNAARLPAVAVIELAVAVKFAPGPAGVSAAADKPVTEPPARTLTSELALVSDPMRISPAVSITPVVPPSVSVPMRMPCAIGAGPGGTSPVRSRVTVEAIEAPVAALTRASVALSICTAPSAVRPVRIRNSSRLTSARPLPSVSVFTSVALVPAAPVPR